MLLRPYSRRTQVLLLLLAFFTSLFAETVLTTGVGSSEVDALTGAKKNALWKVTSTILPETEVKAQQAKIARTILSSASLYIESAKVLSSGLDYGLYSVKAEVVVSVEKLEAALAEQGLYATPVSKPRVMVVLKESDAAGVGSGASSNFALEQTLTKKGYRIIEKEQLEQLQKSSDNKLASMAFKSGADIIVKGNVSVGAAHSKTIYGVTQTTVPVTMNVRLVRADNAEIISSISKTVSDKTMDAGSARTNALRKGNALIAKTVDQAIAKYWHKQSSGIRSFELIAEGKAGPLQSLPSKLKPLSAFLSVQLRYMEDNAARYDCKVRGSLQDIRAAIEGTGAWRVVGLGSGRMKIKSGVATGGELEIGMKAPDFSITAFEIANIFPSLLKYYEKNEIAKVSLKVASGSSINKGKVSISIPSLMDLPVEKQVTLSSGQEKTVNMALLFNEEKLLAVKSQKSVPAQVVISFYQNGKEHKRNLVVPVKVHQVNGMDWNDMASLGSFITYENTTVDKLARISIDALEKGAMNDQFEEALAIFAALRTYGITYIKDPANSYGNGLDKIQFPVETLEKKSGDCDDTSILMASLLSAVNIPVAFIVYADHVLIMFDTGIFAKNVDKLGVDAENVIIHNGRCWIPIETTSLKKSFFEAWTIAASEFRQAVKDKEHIDIVSVEDAWKKYQPFNYTKNLSITIPGTKSAISNELATVEKKTKELLIQQINTLKSAGILNVAQQNKLGALYARAGLYSDAVSHMKKVTTRASNDHVSLNNYGCAILLSGGEKAEHEALAQFEKSIAIQKTSEAMVNKALCYYLMATTDEGVEKFVQTLITVQGSLPKDKSLDKLLGLELSKKEEGRAAGEHTKEKPKTIDKSRLQDMIRKRVIARDIKSSSTASSYGGNVMPFGGVRSVDPTQLAAIADLICWLEK